MYIIRCRVSGGVTGTRTSVLKEHGQVKYYPTKEEAEQQAKALTRTMNNTNSIACFKYWASEE
jgi:hypothetical protein